VAQKNKPTAGKVEQARAGLMRAQALPACRTSEPVWRPCPE